MVAASRSLSCVRKRDRISTQLHHISTEDMLVMFYLTGTFFCVTTRAQSFPLTATEVSPPWLMALKAYSERQETTVDTECECVCLHMFNHHVTTAVITTNLSAAFDKFASSIMISCSLLMCKHQ